MNDYELGMKMVEEEELLLFIDAYVIATGQRLKIAGAGERPDFFCRRPNGRLVGVELTDIRRHPGAAVDDEIFRRRESADEYDTVERICSSIEKKERKRTTGNWGLRQNTMLVLQVKDCPLDDLASFLAGLGPGDFKNHGFKEVWVADHSEFDVYGNIELFGLYPRRRWGHFEVARGKPYG